MSKKIINVREIVRDIISGMTDAELMDKYRLTAKGLVRVQEKLLEGNHISRSELEWKPMDFDDTATIDML